VAGARLCARPAELLGIIWNITEYDVPLYIHFNCWIGLEILHVGALFIDHPEPHE